MIARYDVIIIADMIAMIITFRHARTHVLQFGTGSNAASLLCQNCAIIANAYCTSLHKVGSCAMIVGAFGGCVTGPGSGASII